MTNEELMAGFLDRSLSEDELLELERRQEASPELARELRELVTVEGLLLTAAPIAMAPIDFLHNVENTVAAKVAAGSSMTSAGIFSTMSVSWGWVAAAATAIIGTTAAVMMINSTNDQQTPAAIEQRIDVNSAPSVSNPAPTTLVPESTPEVRVEPRSQTMAADAAESVVTPPATPRDGVGLGTAENPSPTLAKLISEYEACRNSNDMTRCIQLGISIGDKARKEHLYGMGEQYLQDALDAATQKHIVEYQVRALGNLGLLARDKGEVGVAKDMLTKAVTLGQQNNLDVYRWSDHLNALSD
jgi:hypothetical protein